MEIRTDDNKKNTSTAFYNTQLKSKRSTPHCNKSNCCEMLNCWQRKMKWTLKWNGKYLNGEEQQYPPQNRSITPEESTLAGEAVGRDDGAANASTGVSMIIFSISKLGMMRPLPWIHDNTMYIYIYWKDLEKLNPLYIFHRISIIKAACLKIRLKRKTILWPFFIYLWHMKGLHMVIHMHFII